MYAFSPVCMYVNKPMIRICVHACVHACVRVMFHCSCNWYYYLYLLIDHVTVLRESLGPPISRACWTNTVHWLIPRRSWSTTGWEHSRPYRLYTSRKGSKSTTSCVGYNFWSRLSSGRCDHVSCKRKCKSLPKISLRFASMFTFHDPAIRSVMAACWRGNPWCHCQLANCCWVFLCSVKPPPPLPPIVAIHLFIF